MIDLPLILASRSPRRRELLAATGRNFIILTPDEEVEDDRRSDETPKDYVARLAVQKAENVASKIDLGLIIACDTIVVCRDQILGKPVDRPDAEKMLKQLRGETHWVLSGLCLLRKSGDNTDFSVEVESTELFMQPISDREIEDYLDGGAWQGKAGAFGYQDRNAWISVVRGSETNVVGLPMELLEHMFVSAPFSKLP